MGVARISSRAEWTSSSTAELTPKPFNLRCSSSQRDSDCLFTIRVFVTSCRQASVP
jgi:hypothetical protein